MMRLLKLAGVMMATRFYQDQVVQQLSNNPAAGANQRTLLIASDEEQKLDRREDTVLKRDICSEYHRYLME